MSPLNMVDIKDVKDLRQNFQDLKNKNKLKKTFLFGYDVKETDNYITSAEADRELEKNAFLERQRELESVVKNLNEQKERLEIAVREGQQKLRESERENQERDALISDLSARIDEYEKTVAAYEQELKKKEDAVVFIENENLKNRLSAAIEERNEYAGLCESYRNENEMYKKKNEALEAEVDKLSERLAFELETSREQRAEIGLQISKMVENNRFFYESIMQGLETLVSGGQKYKSEAEALTEKLKEKLAFLYPAFTN